MSIRDIINALSLEDRKGLMYAFEEGISSYIEYKEGLFVGVNIKDEKLSIEKQEGQWSKGTILR